MSGFPGLAAYQDDFLRELLAPRPSGDGGDGPCAAIARQPGFRVYRNNFRKACVDALQANYPAIGRLVGEEWLRAAAARFVAESPPREPMLAAYGQGFADFLARFDPARELPYLPAVARLDRAWTEAFLAPEAAALDANALAAIAPDDLPDAVLQPHPAARWLWFDEVPAYSIWRSNREEGEVGEDWSWTGEGALLTRPREQVRWRAIPREACRLLDACAQGLRLEAAAESAFERFGDEQARQLTGMLAGLIAAGAFASLSHSGRDA